MSADSLNNDCRACLQRNGYDPSRWLLAVSGMLHDVITAPLIVSDPEFCLTKLTSGSWRTELEFYLPLQRLSGARLRNLFDGLLDPVRHGDFGELLSALHLHETRGMLHGFIDMVFERNGRYYIIDWKSNHLGNRPEAYGQSRLSQAMAQHAYILQYHLYTLALDRLLRLRLPGYEYETHFGGAIYLFLRGVLSDNPDCGIYRDRPSLEFIRRANQELLAKATDLFVR
jgi:exodeoxyribonuclease V beta subunit